MNNFAIDNLIKKFKNLFPEDKGISFSELDAIEKKLQIILPNDFKEISKYYSGGFLGSQSIFNFTADEKDGYGIVSRTLTYRNSVHLPMHIVAFYEEHGFIYMETQDNASKLSPVIECSIEDVYNLASEKPLLYNPTIFPSFTDFFAYLLDQEEAEREAK